MKPVQFLIVAAIAMLSPAVGAADSEQPTAVFGFQDMSCGAWAKSASSVEERQLYLYWIRGFVSGYNYGSKTKQIRLAAMPSQETLTLYIDKYCREKPLNLFVGAAFDLVKELGARK